MSDYPDADEEFDLMYGDDIDLIRSQNTQPNQPNTQTNISQNIESTSTSRKRTVEDLFGDIDDIDDYPRKEIQLPKPKKLKKENNDNIEKLALIEHILELRKEAQENFSHSLSGINKNNVSLFRDSIRDHVSLRVPQYPFTVATSTEGERLYIRTYTDTYWEKEIKQVSSSTGLDTPLGRNFDDIWDEAQQLIAEDFNEDIELINNDLNTDSSLWVEAYKPTKYMDLLSDEATNRMLLRWIKLWDRIVFKRRFKLSANLNQFQRNFLEVDPDHRPKYKLVLLAGPPGLGKTTLAHLVALHAGYKPMEVNASDDRTLDTFKRVLDNATTMTSVLDSEKRPNCVIFDEIDGAPANSIDYLCKYVKGVLKQKSNKQKNNEGDTKGHKILKRPIIAICNDAYVPSLRTLRQMALVLHVPAISTGRLTQRLVEISVKEDVKVNQTVLMTLAEKTNCDIRNCLSMLQFFKVQNATGMNTTPTLEQVLKLSHCKDVNKGLFQVWSEIFHLQRNKDKTYPSAQDRSKKIQRSSYSFDFDKLSSGVFENYVRLSSVRDNLSSIKKALDWFTWMDVMNTKLQHSQSYQLSPYLTWGFVQWHFLFGNLPNSLNQRVFTKTFPNAKFKGVGVTDRSVVLPVKDDSNKILFPRASGEVRSQTQKTDALLTDLLNHMSTQTRLYTSKSNLVLDVIPMLGYLINPSLRPVHLHLYTKQEKDALTGVVGTMIDYGLNYIQERTLEGTYVFTLDPNIEELSTFSTSGGYSKTVTYPNRQLIAREIDCEKMRRLEVVRCGNWKQTKEKVAPPPVPVKVPNHLAQLTPKKPNIIKNEKQFFVFRKTKDEGESAEKGGFKGTGIYFQFKEGHTNAVKKTIKVLNLLQI